MLCLCCLVTALWAKESQRHSSRSVSVLVKWLVGALREGWSGFKELIASILTVNQGFLNCLLKHQNDGGSIQNTFDYVHLRWAVFKLGWHYLIVLVRSEIGGIAFVILWEFYRLELLIRKQNECWRDWPFFPSAIQTVESMQGIWFWYRKNCIPSKKRP